MKLSCLFLFFLSVPCVLAQTNAEIYYNEFDTLVDSYGTDLNNGQRFEDLYLTASDDEFRFFMTKASVVGVVHYNSQSFFQCALKYDLLEDNLLFKYTNSSNQYDIILDKSLVESFSFGGKTFVTLPEKASDFPFFKNGFFEIIIQNEDFNVYVKHEKFKKKELGTKAIYYTYAKKETFVLEYKTVYYEINSYTDILKILPERKEAIKLFYKNNQNLNSQNRIEFMKKLFASLSIIN